MLQEFVVATSLSLPFNLKDPCRYLVSSCLKCVPHNVVYTWRVQGLPYNDFQAHAYRTLTPNANLQSVTLKRPLHVRTYIHTYIQTDRQTDIHTHTDIYIYICILVYMHHVILSHLTTDILALTLGKVPSSQSAAGRDLPVSTALATSRTLLVSGSLRGSIRCCGFGVLGFRG